MSGKVVHFRVAFIFMCLDILYTPHRSLDLASLGCFEKLQLFGVSPDKYFCTYMADSKNARKSLRNTAGTNRVGSTAIISGLPDRGEVVLRIQVSSEASFCAAPLF